MFRFDHSFAALPEVLFARQNPVPVAAPALIIYNDALAKELAINAGSSHETAEILAGNRLPEGSQPLAQAYAGHQFENFTMLGDGRAILLGEHLTSRGERIDVQLKGSGRTPFSRGGDGRAALGPMLREYIISEAMAGLGIPTTRSLAVVATGETVQRNIPLAGAVLTRLAASYIRVGTFEYAVRLGHLDALRALADYAINRHYPELEQGDYVGFLRHVVDRQASLVAQWMRVGFIHGVMNTDNMAISGETIDYGPCAFMDAYHPDTVFSSIDVHGRYAYGNQPAMAQWNLARFAETLLPLLSDEPERAVRLAEEAIHAFSDRYQYHWLTNMRRKLGLIVPRPDDAQLIQTLLQLMETHHLDYTSSFRGLAEGNSLPESEECKHWYERWQELTPDMALLKAHSPLVIPRNHLVEKALADMLEGDRRTMDQLLELLRDPYTERPLERRYFVPPSPHVPYYTFCGT